MVTAPLTLNREEKLLVGNIAMAHALIHILELTYAAILPFLILQFEEGLFVMGIAATFFALAFGLGALPAGVLADRIGSRRVLLICLLGGAAGAIGVALSPNIYTFTTSLALTGLLLGLYHPAAMSLISRGVREKALGRGLAVHGIGGSFGLAAAPLLAAGLAAAFSWRVAYLVPGFLSLLVAVILHRASVQASKRNTHQPTATETTPAPIDPPKKVLVLPLLMVFAIFVINGFIYRGMITFLPMHLKESVHFSLAGIDAVAIAGAFTTIALLFGALGQWIGGTLGDKTHRELVMLPATLIMALFLIIMGKVTGLPLVLAGAMMAVAHFMQQPLQTGLIADYSPKHLHGRMYGISFFSTFGLGSFAAAFAGWIAERSGTAVVFLSLGAVGVVLSLASAYLLWMGYRRWRASPL